MKLIKLNPNKVNLGKTYAHSSGRTFLAFHYVSNGVSMEVELLEHIPNEVSKKHYVAVKDFEARLASGSLTMVD